LAAGQDSEPPSTITEPEATVVALDSVEPIVLTGIEIRSVVANTVRVMRIEMNEGAKGPHHNHPDEELFLVVEGQVRAIGGDDTFMLNPGDVFVVPPFVAHQLEAIVDSVLIEVGGPGPALDLIGRE
jgi:quercetin dioxygenase-like cupin family protein